MLGDFNFPEKVITDEGPQFLSFFQSFATSYRFCLTFSSSKYAQNNEKEETAVQAGKNFY